MDCADSCPVGEPPVDDSVYRTVGGMNMVTFVIGIVLGGIGVLSVLVKTFLPKTRETRKPF